MTDLLVLLWLGDVSANVAELLFWLAIGGGLGGSFILFIWFTETGNFPLSKRAAVLCASACLAAVLIASIIPSRQWFYMAAGGVATAKALDSTIGQKVTKLVEQKLDEALGEVKK